MHRIVRVLTSPRLAFVILAFIAMYAAVAASLPWFLSPGARVPSWAAALRLERPFVVEQAFHDGGAFDLTEGETVRLADPGASSPASAAPSRARARLP